MNTMVGLEASLHTYVGEEVGELMKSDSQPVAAFAAESEAVDDDVDPFSLGDFDPEELLKSPMLGNSINGFSHSISENSFGTYDVGDLDCKPCSLPTQSMTNGFQSQVRSYDAMKQHPSMQQQQDLYPAAMGQLREESASSDLAGAMQGLGHHEVGDKFNMRFGNQPLSPPRRLDSIKHSPMPPAPMTPSQHIPQQMKFQDQGGPYQSQVPQQSSSFGGSGVEHQPNANPYNDQMSNLLMASPSASNYSSPRHGASYLSPGPTNSFTGAVPVVPQAAPFANVSQSNSSCYSSPSRQGSSYASQGPQDLNQLQQMQQFVSQPPSGAMHSNNAAGLSQTIHGEPYRTSSMNSMMNQGLNSSMHGDTSLTSSLRSSSVHGTNQFVPSPGFSNVSIASGMQMNKSYHGERSLDVSSHSQTPTGAPLSEAMEKLCESMKRSAMSRSMIKQYSGRGPMLKQGSSRGLMRQNSSRSGMLDDVSSGRGTPTGMVPVRRVSMNAKHQLQHPVRGVYRHDSQQSLNHSNHSISLHMDGRNMGNL
jgi:hypothetical protein